MSDREGFVAMTTPEQVLNAGGVSRRRRNLSNKRRSPSGSRRRAQTPDRTRSNDDDDDNEPERPITPPVKAPRSKSGQRSTSTSREKRRSTSASEGEGEVITSSITILPSEKGLVVTSVTQGEEVPDVTEHVREPEVVHAQVVTDDGVAQNQDVQVPVKDVEIEKVEEKVVEKEPVEEVKKEMEVEEKVKENEVVEEKKDVVPKAKPEAVWLPFLKEIWKEWRLFKKIHNDTYRKIQMERNKCFSHLIILMIFCGFGGLIFRFTEGAFESFYKCGVKRVKRDFIDALWLGSHNLREDDWKSQARRKLMEFEEQLHAAHEAGVHSYSGRRAWTFLNAVVYCITVVTTIGYGDISPTTITGQAITIVYAIFGIPMFLILLTDFGKLFTRGIKFLWAFVRRLYYTGSCRKVRRTGPVQEVMKGVQFVYEFATNRRPSQMDGEVGPGELGMHMTSPPLDGSIPGTPALSNFEVDDEFNLPISVAVVVLLIYIFLGATIFYIWEKWNFFESFYFVFISMSTIGFGDFVPQHPVSMILSIVYLVFGLALTSMCINVVQEKLSASFQQASAKIGATIGLRLAQEEEAAMTPAPPPEVELPEVHQPSPNMKKSQST